MSKEKDKQVSSNQVSPRDLMTEEELIQYLRIPEISQAKDYHNVIDNLKRFRDLPRIHICNKPLYPKKAIDKWIEEEVKTGR